MDANLKVVSENVFSVLLLYVVFAIVAKWIDLFDIWQKVIYHKIQIYTSIK